MDSIDTIAIDNDWRTAQELYAQGVAPVEIARQCGVSEYALTARARRYGWAAARRHAKTVARQELAAEWEDLLASSIMRDARKWASTGELPNDPGARRQWESARQAHIEAARAMFGLDADAAASSTWTSTQPIIDITPTHASAGDHSVVDVSSVNAQAQLTDAVATHVTTPGSAAAMAAIDASNVAT